MQPVRAGCQWHWIAQFRHPFRIHRRVANCDEAAHRVANHFEPCVQAKGVDRVFQCCHVFLDRVTCILWGGRFAEAKQVHGDDSMPFNEHGHQQFERH